MAFVALSFLELVHSFNIRSDKSIFKIGVLKNIYLIGAVILGIMLQSIVVLVPTFTKIFKIVPLNKAQWSYVILFSFLPILIIEIQKKINEIKFGKVLYKMEA